MSTWPLLVTCFTQPLTDKVGLVLILHQPPPRSELGIKAHMNAIDHLRASNGLEKQLRNQW